MHGYRYEEDGSSNSNSFDSEEEETDDVEFERQAGLDHRRRRYVSDEYESPEEELVPIAFPIWNFGTRNLVISLCHGLLLRPVDDTLVIQRLTNKTEKIDNVQLALTSLKISAFRIKEIELQHCVLSSGNYLKLFSPMKNLKCITLDGCRIDEQPSSQEPLNLKNVINLKLLSSDGMLICQIFRGFNNLQTLKVEIDEDWNEDECEALEKFIQQQKSLTSLSVANTWKNQHLFEFNNISYQLKSLALNFLSLSPTSIDFFQKQNELREIEMGFQKLIGIESIILKEIFKKLEVRTIKIKTDTEETIDETCFAEVKPNLVVQELEFEEKIPSESLLKCLVSCMPNLLSVKVKCSAKKEADEVYCSAIACVEHLEWLHLLDVHINALIPLQVHFSSLNGVKLQIFDDNTDAQPLMELLEENPQITIVEISFSSLKIDSADCSFILESLPGLTSLLVANFDNIESVMQTILACENNKMLEMVIVTAHEKLKISKQSLKALEDAGINIKVIDHEMW